MSDLHTSILVDGVDADRKTDVAELRDLTARVLARAVEIVTSVPGANPRPAQAKVAADIAEAMIDAGHVAAVAPTGSGKTLAALAPALSAAALNRERTILSTESLSLQAQILDKDAPTVIQALSDVTGYEASVAVLKGWSNYVCQRAVLAAVGALLDRRLDPHDDLSGSDCEELAREVAQSRHADADLLAWAVRQCGDSNAPGDRHSYPQALTSAAWSGVSVTPDACPGVATCPLSDWCKAATAKQAASEADIVVTNHSLLAVQAAKGVPVVNGSRSLGQFDHIIVDEAHALPASVRNQGAGEMSGTRLLSLLSGLERLLVPGKTLNEIAARFHTVAAIVDNTILNGAHGEQGVVRIKPDSTDLDFDVQVADLLNAAAAAVITVCAHAVRAAEDGSSGAAKTEMDARRLLGRIEALSADLKAATRSTKGIARWLETQPHPAVKFSAVEVGGALRQNLWNGCAPTDVDADSSTAVNPSEPTPQPLSVGCISATLGTGFSAQAGLATQVTVHPSPFTDAYSRSMLFVPKCLGEDAKAVAGQGFGGKPRFDVLRHAGWARNIAAELVAASGGGALVLCATARDGKAMADHLRLMSVGRWQVLDQWSGRPIGHLVSDWRQDTNAVLVGTRSLMTGTDAPGQTCRLVVIDRIPRAAGNPVDDARVEAAMERANTDKWSADRMVYVADAALLLEQESGRLIRTSEDRGMVAILDPRLLKRQGSAFTYPEPTRRTYLSALSSFTSRLTDKQRALDWLREQQAGTAAQGKE